MNKQYINDYGFVPTTFWISNCDLPIYPGGATICGIPLAIIGILGPIAIELEGTIPTGGEVQWKQSAYV